jgi:prokaryotic ubiquitin-like protein Pup
MAGGQEHKQPSKGSTEQDEAEPTTAADVAEHKAKLDDAVDAILDEIDDVLEENAAEFVSSFVQKGGE